MSSLVGTSFFHDLTFQLQAQNHLKKIAKLSNHFDPNPNNRLKLTESNRCYRYKAVIDRVEKRPRTLSEIC